MHVANKNIKKARIVSQIKVNEGRIEGVWLTKRQRMLE